MITAIFRVSEFLGFLWYKNFFCFFCSRIFLLRGYIAYINVVFAVSVQQQQQQLQQQRQQLQLQQQQQQQQQLRHMMMNQVGNITKTLIQVLSNRWGVAAHLCTFFKKKIVILYTFLGIHLRT